jgi:nitrogen regulatory protein PII
MKKIEAVIHPSRLKALQSGFRRMGIQSRPVVSSVNRLPHDSDPVLAEELTPGIGRLGDPLARNSAELKIELIVSDRQVFKVIDTILALGRHSAADSGQVAIFDVDQSLSIEGEG